MILIKYVRQANLGSKTKFISRDLYSGLTSLFSHFTSKLWQTQRHLLFSQPGNNRSTLYQDETFCRKNRSHALLIFSNPSVNNFMNTRHLRNLTRSSLVKLLRKRRFTRGCPEHRKTIQILPVEFQSLDLCRKDLRQIWPWIRTVA